jgi:hypothetical protein
MTRLGARALLLDMACDFQDRAERMEQQFITLDLLETHVSVAAREHAPD